MTHILRIGIQISPTDPFWVQVHEVMWQRAQQLSLELVEVTIQNAHVLTIDGQQEAVEDLIVQELDALIANTYPLELLTSVIDRGIPIIYVAEIGLRHPRFVSRLGLYEAAEMLGAFLGERLPSGSHIVVLGGWMEGLDYGRSRMAGFRAALPADREFTMTNIPSAWDYDDARQRITAYLHEHPTQRVDAIFGLSDSLALAARDACKLLGRSSPYPQIVGVNGDPLALAAIADGTMVATVETDVSDIAEQAVDLAHRAALRLPLPDTFRNRQRLVTAQNVAEVAVGKLISLANLPSRLVGVNRRNEEQLLTQYETSLAIDRQIGTILDEQQLSLAITDLIRETYGFDQAQFLIYLADCAQLVDVSDSRSIKGRITIDPDGPLAHALHTNQTVFIPNNAVSHRFAPDPRWPQVRGRVVVPVHFGGQIVGLLDLRSHRAAHLTREERTGLQLLADQLGISMRNAELYGEAIAARSVAEKADRLKTGLLANVSHELRTPLNVILGYTRTALDTLAGAQVPAADGISHDLTQVYRSGEHLLRLINDLLDLSRAEIGELDLLLERIETREFLAEIFRSSADNFGGEDVSWELSLADDLPAIEADPLRLRQVLYNLLQNASKFTRRGRISLGAEVADSELHIWVADTGVGIAEDLGEQIFEPFVTNDAGARRREGIGLGLSIARQLVLLHRGRLTVESQPGVGSIFHLFLPVPRRANDSAPLPLALLLVSDAGVPPPALVQLANRRELALITITPDDDLAVVTQHYHPALLILDLSTTVGPGERAVDQLRGLHHLGPVPVMIYQRSSGGSGDPLATATSVLRKPLEASALLDALADLDPGADGGSILIVEDDVAARGLHRRLIAEHLPSYRICEAVDGRAALAQIAAEIPRLILLDLLMPDLDGFAVLEALRADPRTSAVPVLVLSGRALSGDDIRRLGEARVTFQSKDILSEGELVAALQRVIDRADPLPPPTSALVKAAIAYIQQHYDEPLARQSIADQVGVSKDYLSRIFHQEIGLSPWEYLIRYRVLRAKDLLRSTSYSIAEVAVRVGFETVTYFSHIFHREVGCSPRDFRAGRFSATTARDS